MTCDCSDLVAGEAVKVILILKSPRCSQLTSLQERKKNKPTNEPSVWNQSELNNAFPRRRSELFASFCQVPKDPVCTELP